MAVIGVAGEEGQLAEEDNLGLGLLEWCYQQEKEFDWFA